MEGSDSILLISRADDAPKPEVSVRQADGTVVVPQATGPAGWVAALRGRKWDLILSPPDLLLEHAFERGQREVLELIAAGGPLAQQLEQIVLLIEAQAPGMLCSILLLDRDQSRLHTGAAPHLPSEFMAAIDGAKIGPCEGSCGSAAYRGERVVVEDIASHEYWKNYRELALPHGLRACWSSPIKSARGHVLGTFAMYFEEPRGPRPQEIHWVDRATHIASIAIARDLSEAKRRLHAYLHDTVSDVIFYLGVEPGEQFRFLSINPAFGMATGLPGERVVKQLVQDVIPEPSLSKVLGYYRQAIAEKRTVRWHEVTPYPTGIKHGDVAVMPIFSNQGVCTNLLGTVHDVTDLYQAQERVYRAQRLESLGTLLSGLAHDFNNILSAITSNAGLALQEAEREGPRESLSQIERAAARGAELVRQMLTFSSQQEPQRASVELPEIVMEALALLRASLPRAIKVETSFARDLPRIFADSTQVHQVVINLITNAAHAMSACGGVLRVRADRLLLDDDGARQRGLTPGTFVRLAIVDTGTGMNDAILERIFDPFFTTKESGTGLGLAVVHGIVKAHQGAVIVQSTLGAGSEFQVYFPAEPNG